MDVCQAQAHPVAVCRHTDPGESRGAELILNATNSRKEDLATAIKRTLAEGTQTLLDAFRPCRKLPCLSKTQTRQDVASRLRTEMSSSRSGQWMPTPLPMSRQLLRCSGVPCKRRGNQARGAETVRPSERRRTNSASNTCTSITSDDTLLAKMLIPLQPKQFPVFLN